MYTRVAPQKEAGVVCRPVEVGRDVLRNKQNVAKRRVSSAVAEHRDWEDRPRARRFKSK